VVFLDYQSFHLSAHGRFQPAGANPARTHLDPIRLATLLVRRRNTESRLVGVRVYRGDPDRGRQPVSAGANNRQAAAWLRDPLVTVVRRPLSYPRGWPQVPPQEKGIDVALAVDFVRLPIERAYDVGIVASRDSDLLPAIETVVDLKLARVEVASWTRLSWLRLPGRNLPWCHHLDRDDYRAVLDDTEHNDRVASGRWSSPTRMSARPAS
jgi:hypothetical protein